MGVVYLSLQEHIRAHELLAEVFPTHDGLCSVPALLSGDHMHEAPPLTYGDEGKLVVHGDVKDPNHIDYHRMHFARCGSFNLWFPHLDYRSVPGVTPELLMLGLPSNPWSASGVTLGVRNYLLGELSL